MDARCCANPDTVPYRHRAPGSSYKDQTLCFNGRVKADHLCVAECSKPGTLCRTCRRMTDLS